jgi:hypothetical protein
MTKQHKLKVVITFHDWSEPVEDYVWGDGSPEFIDSVKANVMRAYKDVCNVMVFPEAMVTNKVVYTGDMPDTARTERPTLIKADLGPNAGRDFKKRLFE